jgi:hypothetical protein
MKNDVEQAAQTAHTMMVLLNIAIKVLSAEVVTFFALSLDAGVFVWAIQTESTIRLVGAVLFTVASWCLIHLRPRSRNE